MPSGITLAAAKVVARAEIDARFGPIPPVNATQYAIINQRREDMAYIVATQSPYVRDNAIVHPDTMAVVPSAMSNPSGSLTGDGSVQVGTGSLS